MGLGARLALLFAAVAAATAFLVGGASYVTTDRQVTAEVDQFLKERFTDLTNGDRQQPSDRRDQRRDPEPIAISADSEVQVLSESGDIVSNTGLLLPVSDTDLQVADRNNDAVLRTVVIDDTDYRMITGHLDGGGAIQVARSLDESTGLLEVLQTRLLIIAGTLAALAAAVGWIVAQRTTRPLRALTSAVGTVAETKDFTTPVEASGHDEVGRLADGFNRMLDALRSSQEQQHRLVQDAAHELRTPLTSITANVDWLVRAPDVDSQTRSETLGGIRRELGELNDVIAEIIELATDRHAPPSLVPTDLVAVVESAVDQFRRRSGRTVSVTAAPAMVRGDADALERAVTNLLSNADKYSPAPAPVAVEVGPDGVYVIDAGPGIPESDRHLVFSRFYRRDEDRAKPGSGLGLSIVAGIVEQHGGTVAVADAPQGGARVGFRIPLM